MRKTILILGCFLAVGLTSVSCSRDNNSRDNDNSTGIIIGEQLPTAAQNFMKTHFGGVKVHKIEKNTVPDEDGTLYEVKLANGFEVGFDKNGEWTEVSSPDATTLPSSVTSLLPKKIQDYIIKNNSMLSIAEMEKKHFGYRVEFESTLEFLFDVNGNIIGIN